jgi:hypothetical protein
LIFYFAEFLAKSAGRTQIFFVRRADFLSIVNRANFCRSNALGLVKIPLNYLSLCMIGNPDGLHDSKILAMPIASMGPLRPWG